MNSKALRIALVVALCLSAVRASEAQTRNSRQAKKRPDSGAGADTSATLAAVQRCLLRLAMAQIEPEPGEDLSEFEKEMADAPPEIRGPLPTSAPERRRQAKAIKVTLRATQSWATMVAKDPLFRKRPPDLAGAYARAIAHWVSFLGCKVKPSALSRALEPFATHFQTYWRDKYPRDIAKPSNPDWETIFMQTSDHFLKTSMSR